MAKYEKTYAIKSASLWYNEPVVVCWGIPINPSYLDSGMTDRYGKKLNKKQANSLYNHRKVQRDEWRKNTDNIMGENYED